MVTTRDNSNSKSVYSHTTDIKLKVQGTEEDMREFKKRFETALPDMDCYIMHQSDLFQNKSDSTIFRGYIHVGMNIRK